jgi:copper chaperone
MIQLKIEGMTCGHCVKTVKETLSKVPGVDDVTEVSLERGEAIVSGEVETEALVAALREEGYEARVA